MIAPPGLIQKEKVHIICEKGAQISILANKIVTMMTQFYHQRVQPNNTLIFFLFSRYYVYITLLI